MSAGFAAAIAVIFGAGVYAMLNRDLVRVVVGIALISYAVNLFLLAVSQARGAAPVHPLPDGAAVSDPLPQALVLTAVVISAGTTAVVIGIVHSAFRHFGSLDEPVVTTRTADESSPPGGER